ncbi:ImuA family protein [Roseibium aestuarii]|uniref:ImuA family protein n=1 Tax=Roseibium aestuarii TaxID=2600299 RepID=A0ABW4K006_9HYPH|nr:hypothetical protein [Roseibium aestuarii]
MLSKDLSTAFPLSSGRLHEVQGPAAPSLAAIAIARSGGKALWIQESWNRALIHPAGLALFLDPADQLLARTASQAESLAVGEEALRSGTVGFVVIELVQPIGLREGRRLQLAARTGFETGLRSGPSSGINPVQPTCICLIPEGAGSNVAETRWQAEPVFDPVNRDSTLMRWEIIKNKKGTFGTWHVQWIRETRCLHVVSPVGERPGVAGAPD